MSQKLRTHFFKREAGLFCCPGGFYNKEILVIVKLRLTTGHIAGPIIEEAIL